LHNSNVNAKLQNMLTPEDLEAIDQLIEKRTKALKKDLQEQIIDLEEVFKDKTANLEASVFQTRAELQEESRSIKRSLREIKDSLHTIIDFFDEQYLDLKQKVQKIEQHIHLPIDS
jgi:glycine cleavage system pyridoxal-binding protein P